MTAAAFISVYDVIAYHRVDRDLYAALLLALRVAPDVARNAVALFIWLEQIGVHVIRFTAPISDHSLIVRLLTEAEVVLDSIRLDTAASDRDYCSTPLLASLVDEPLDQEFFHRNQDAMMRGVARVLDDVGRVIFDDRLHGLFEEYVAAAACEEKGEGDDDRQLPPPPAMPSELAGPYKWHANARTREDRRSMFITFFDGRPLNQKDIFEYFTGRWGNCIERVEIMRPTVTRGVTPINGKIIFTSESYIDIMLNGKLCIKFRIKGTLLWAQRYE